MNGKTKEIIDFIASVLIDTTGNEFIQKWKVKREISKILKNDRRNIKIYFNADAETDLYNYIEEFIIFHAFKEVSFYSSMELTTEQEEKLWTVFSDFIKVQTGNKYVDGNYKDKIIRCLNLHNEAINNIMDEQNLFRMKVMLDQNKAINNSLTQIIDTLNTETKLQNKDDDLDYVVEQIETVIKSYRYDINNFRKIQLFCIIVMILVYIFIICLFSASFSEVFSIDVIFYFISIFGLVFEAPAFLFTVYITKKINGLEKNVEEVRKNLLKIHKKAYFRMLEKKYKMHKIHDNIKMLYEAYIALCDYISNDIDEGCTNCPLGANKQNKCRWSEFRNILKEIREEVYT